LHQISHFEVEKCEAGSDQWLPIKTTKGLSLEVNNLVRFLLSKSEVLDIRLDGCGAKLGGGIGSKSVKGSLELNKEAMLSVWLG
jgi:hypothetical protein